MTNDEWQARDARFNSIRHSAFVIHLLLLRISRSGRKLISVALRYVNVWSNQPNNKNNAGVAIAPPTVITIHCHSENQLNAGAWPPVSNSNNTAAGTNALALNPRTVCANN